MTQVNILLYRQSSPETEQFVKANLETKASLAISGALDGLTDDEIRSMKAETISKGVPVGLTNGDTIFVDHDQIDHRARNIILGMQSKQSHTTVMLCTLPWPQLEDLDNVVCPSRLLEANAMALLPKGGTLGVLQPIAETAEEEILHWNGLGVPVVSAIADPENEDDQVLKEACRSLIDQGADLIVLDCLAFVRAHWQQVRDWTDRPVILPMAVIGKMLDAAYG